jgi:hypothetical protein
LVKRGGPGIYQTQQGFLVCLGDGLCFEELLTTLDEAIFAQDTAVHPRNAGKRTCKWCEDGAPEWSYHAKVWIHRRERLDRRCENPPNDYGYTTQVPEETISDEERKGLRKNAGKPL